jgi:hypothetical protein
MTKKSAPESPQVDEKWQAEDDGRTLTRAQEIRLDEKRHKAALGHLKKQATASSSAVDLEIKVKKGLAAAFPKNKCKECSHAGH